MNDPVVLKEDKLVVVDACSFKIHDLVFMRNEKFFMDDFLELVEGYLSRKFNFDGFSGNSSDINFNFPTFENRFFIKEPLCFKGIRVIALIHLTGIP